MLVAAACRAHAGDARRLPIGRGRGARLLRSLVCCIALIGYGGMAAGAQDSAKWVEGTHYFLLQPAQPTSTPGKIEVLDVFSYACPACNQFQPTVDRLKAALPANAQIAYLPAAFNPAEDWPVFQRAFLAAQILGVAEQSHDAMYDAVWGNGSLAIVEKATRRLLPREQQPTIEDVAKFYARYGVKADAFVAAATSFTVDSQMKHCDAQIRDYQVDGTPTLIVNGKYRLTPTSAGGFLQTIDLVLYLVARESGK
jgi:thiol:disulfide interchange protein DsbA